MTRHLISIDDLDRAGIERILELAPSRSPRSPAARSRRCRRSRAAPSSTSSTSPRPARARRFELAAKRLSADVVSIRSAGSSVDKGESLQGHGADAQRLRPGRDRDPLTLRRGGAADRRLDRRRRVNAGDGKHEHPTQALLDVFTLTQRLDSLEGLNIWIVGDVLHSRVARSDILAFQRMGAEVTVCGPPTLIPREIEALGCGSPGRRSQNLHEADVVYVLRMQHERMHEAYVPTLREYAQRYQVNLQRLREGQLLMHPGPVNRGVELSGDAIDSDVALIGAQVKSGVAVRMAVLYELLVGAPVLQAVA